MRIVALLAVLAASGCALEGSSGMRAPVAMIGSSGGALRTEDGSAGLAIPPGALTAEARFTVYPWGMEPPNGVGASWRFEPLGQEFAIPAKLTIAYIPSMIPADMSNTELAVYAVQEGKSSILDSTTIDDSHVEFTVSQLGHFGVVWRERRPAAH